MSQAGRVFRSAPSASSYAGNCLSANAVEVFVKLLFDFVRSFQFHPSVAANQQIEESSFARVRFHLLDFRLHRQFRKPVREFPD